MDEKRSVGKTILSAVIFWAIVVFGPFVVYLWNEISPARMEQGMLSYAIFLLVIQGACVAIAYYASSHVFDGAYHKVTFVCCIVSATLFVVMAISKTDFLEQNMQTIISYVFAAIISVVCAVFCARRGK